MRTMNILSNLWRGSSQPKEPVAEEPKATLDLSLLGGGDRISRIELAQVSTPDSTETYRPISHHSLVNRLEDQLNNINQRIVQEQHLITNKGNHYFGLFEIQDKNSPTPSETAQIVGLRNSHDKKFPAGIMAGDAPFICSNLCFDNEIVINRRHTKNFFNVIDGLLQSAVYRLMDKKHITELRNHRYKQVTVDQATVDHLVLDAYRNGACSRSQVLPIIEQFIDPEHDAFIEPTVYSLKNAFTNIWRGNVFSTPKFSAGLHKTLDAYTGFSPTAQVVES